MRSEFAFSPSVLLPLLMGSTLCALSLHVHAAQPLRAEKISIKGKACEEVFPLADGRRFAACGKSLYITPSRGGAEQAKPVGRLQDDTVWAVRELPLNPAVPLGSDTLTALVLVDTGNELCYGTMVMGLLGSGVIKQWGTVDQVLEREENVDCISSAVKLSSAAGAVSLTLPADHSSPTPDGAYKRVHKALVLPMVRAGQFCQKGKAGCGKGVGK
jgi:hypothetical protein